MIMQLNIAAEITSIRNSGNFLIWIVGYVIVISSTTLRVNLGTR